ncbi:MAG: hypothetical protein IPK58_08440 [Acidobacteria bacterium]|nr:hypothetical protein [Acidobacteriota bacterium]
MLSRGPIIRRSANRSHPESACERRPRASACRREPARLRPDRKGLDGLNHTWFRKNENRAGR